MTIQETTEKTDIIDVLSDPKYSLGTYWEILGLKCAEKIYKKYGLDGISIQLVVEPSTDKKVPEPGYHGPIVTL